MTGLDNDINDSFTGNRSAEDWRSRYTTEELWWYDLTMKVYPILCQVAFALGIPGNILSAIVWLRRHITSEGPAALYLSLIHI